MNAKAIRWTAWGVLGVVTVVGAMVSRFPQPAGFVAGELFYLVPIALGAVVAGYAAWRTTGTERHFWAFLCVSMALLSVSETWWSAYLFFVNPNGPHLPNPMELVQVGAAIAFFGMIISLTEFGSDPFPTRIRVFFAVFAAQIVLFVIVYAGWTAGLLIRTSGGTEELGVIAGIYPVFGISMALGMLLVMGRGRTGWRAWEAILTVSILVYSVGLIAWPLWIVDFLTSPKPVAGGLFSTIADLGFGLLIIGIIYRLTEPGNVRAFEPRRFPRADNPWGSAGYSVVLGVAVAALALAAERMPDDYDERTVLFATLLLALTIAGRSLMTALERASERRRADIDPVTGVGALSSMHKALDRQLDAASQTRSRLVIVLFDIDGFKRLNDAHGHSVGDTVLARVAHELTESLPTGTSIFRAGSDSFVAILKGADSSLGLQDAEGAVKAVDRDVRVGSFPVSVSAGVASYPRDALSSERLLEAASAALVAARLGARVAEYEPGQTSLSDGAIRLVQARSRAHLDAVRALAAVIEQREATSHGHGQAVADLARRLGEVLGMSGDELRRLELAALVHDVGKVGVADKILTKPGPLDNDERIAIQEHSLLGERIVAATGMPDVARWIRSHHEQWGGGGYPDGLFAEEIPLESRILMLVGSFEAMTSPRSWRSPSSVGDAIAELRENAGSQFDPRLVDVFARLVEGMQDAPAPLALEQLGVERD